ncbi:hypothetical protein BLNAU_16998 [Blattamonas nauphoetae]|uniref:Uncharacterized protein n=1 Tax=Blattamonas nauphoetae TaxID=2049346 RepID=A0ABQ9X7T6_9EUKA|nr:hypothetical protein BLNAU_16998 [Blattamonas nauphoetae]
MNFLSLLLMVVFPNSVHFFKPRSPSSLREFFASLSDYREVNHSDTDPIIAVPEGLYQAHQLEIVSASLFLLGNKTILAPEENPITQSDQTNEVDPPYRHQSQHPHMMFRLLNSTVHLCLFQLDCRREGWIVASLVSSNVRIHSCTIISNAHTPPFSISSRTGYEDNSIIFVECSHHSPSSPALLPLVSFTRPFDKRDEESPNTPFPDERHELSGSVTVCGTLLTFDSKDVILGTGPLLDLSLPPTTSPADFTPFEGSIVTTLTHSSFENTTSSSSRPSSQSSPLSLSQRLFSSSIDRSVDYLSGTAIMDVNRGGNLICQNTSFTRCKQTAPTHSYQHFTKQLEPTETSLFFFLCTFKDIVSIASGRGLLLKTDDSDVKVSHCSFFNVTAVWSGGAILMNPTTQSKSFTLLDSGFAGCLSDAFGGGSVSVQNIQIVTITNIVFHNSAANMSGGALSLWDTDGTASMAISNCLVSLCKQFEGVPYGGGGFQIANFPSITIDSVHSDLLPDPSITADLLSVGVKDKGDDSIALSFKLSQPITGQILLLVDNAGTTLDPSSPFPTITRVLSFAGSSSTPTLTTTIGDKGVLQLPLEGYRVVTTSAPKTTIHVASGFAFPPFKSERVTQVEGIVVNKENSEATITLGGLGLSAQPFQVVLEREGIDVTSTDNIVFVSATRITIVFPISSMQSSTTLQFGETYTVKAVTDGTDWFAVSPSFTITIPNPPIVTGISSSLSTNCTHFQVLFTGTDLPSTGTFTATLTNGQTFRVGFGMDEVGRSDWIEGNASSSLSFNTSYTLSSLSSESSEILLSQSSFTSSKGPTLKDVQAVLAADPNKVEMTLEAERMPEQDWTLFVQKVGTDERSSFTVSFSSAEDGATTVSVYGSEAILEYETTYTVEKMVLGTLTAALPTTITFTTPDEPARVESIHPRLSSTRNEVIVRLGGIKLTGAPFTVTINRVLPLAPLTAIGIVCEDGIECRFPAAGTGDSNLLFGQHYSITVEDQNSQAVIVNDDVTLKIPFPPTVTKATIEPNSLATSLVIHLEGTGLLLDGDYLVTLKSSESFVVRFISELEGVSREIGIGGSSILQFNTPYKLSSITKVGDESDVVIVGNDVSFTTPHRPTSLTLYVSSSSTSKSPSCGTQVQPCSSMNTAWDVVERVEVKIVTLAILDSTEQNDPIEISEGLQTLIENGSNIDPTLRVGFSASMGEKEGMIVVSKATLELRNVDVVIDSSTPSFVFLFSLNSTIRAKEGSFIGNTAEQTRNEESGPLSTIKHTDLTHLSQGAVNMEGGSLEIESCAFHDNTPASSDFPSLRRNIHCSEGGKIAIESLNGGDGSKDSPSAWISTDNCTLNSTVVDSAKSFFIPTLNKNETIVKDENDSFDVRIVGESMIPCGLGLEVTELDDTTNKTRNTTILDIDTLSPTFSSDTTLSFVITLDHIKSTLDATFEWHARLAFGRNKTTEESFVLKKSLAAIKRARSLDQAKKTLPWLIPVLVFAVAALVVIFIIVCCAFHRRHSKKESNLDKKEMEVEGDKVEENEEKKDEMTAQRVTDIDGNPVFAIRAKNTNNLLHHTIPTTIGSTLLYSNPADDKQKTAKMDEQRLSLRFFNVKEKRS